VSSSKAAGDKSLVVTLVTALPPPVGAAAPFEESFTQPVIKTNSNEKIKIMNEFDFNKIQPLKKLRYSYSYTLISILNYSNLRDMPLYISAFIKTILRE
jgi:hypothetical protein